MNKKTLDTFVKVNAIVEVRHLYGFIKGVLKSDTLGTTDTAYSIVYPNNSIYFHNDDVSYIDVRTIVLKG